MSNDPKFEARPSSQLGQKWCVLVTWKSGQTETITGFVTQYQALTWIKDKSANWVVEKILQKPDRAS